MFLASDTSWVCPGQELLQVAECGCPCRASSLAKEGLGRQCPRGSAKPNKVTRCSCYVLGTRARECLGPRLPHTAPGVTLRCPTQSALVMSRQHCLLRFGGFILI